MNRFQFLLNVLRFKLIGLSSKSINVNLRQRISFSTLFKIGNCSSRISIGQFLHTKRNVTLHADGGEIIIGKHVFINENSSVVAMDSIIIEDNVCIGPNVMIYDHDHNVKEGSGFLKAPILIEKKVWIGANCVILKGVTIGAGSVIAAGTILRKNVPEKTLVFNEARMVFKRI